MTVHDLIQRATSGQKFNRHTLFRPSLVYQVLHDPFWVWCEYHAPRSEAVDETSRYDQILLKQGIEHEQAWIREHYPEAVRIEPVFGFEALRDTFQAMLEGAAAIYQPQLWDLAGESYGKSDLLIRDHGHGSDLGPYHYRLVEIKRSKSLRDYHVLQAGFYNRMLGQIQGYTPAELTVALRGRDERVPCSGQEKRLDEIISKWKTLRGGQGIPEPGRPPDVTSTPWRVYGNKLVETRKDLVLLAGVGAREREKLRRAGIHRIDQIWKTGLKDICQILGDSYGATAYHVAQAYRTGLPILRPGRRLAIPRAKRHLYFDFETSDEVHPTEPPHVYLIGCWDAKRDQFVSFLACGAEDEERIFRDFLDYVGDGKDTRLYHWTDFEVGQMMKVMQRWPALEGPLWELVSSCVDLKRSIQSAVYLPVATFSIKCVAPALGFRWRQEGFGAFESMVCYWDYLEGKEKSSINKSILYNEDDCLAMWHIDQELSRRLG
ncbi:MAG: TM0106 family RecB-like putative nuclease [Candidatus Binatia bacterium]